MTAFNTEYRVVGVQVEPPEEGAEAVTINTVVGFILPVGPNQAGIVPLGTVGFKADREMLKTLVEGIETALETLPAKTGIVTANSMAQADEEARRLRAIGLDKG